MQNNNMLTTWPHFLLALQHCFGPSHFDDPQGDLFKLQQTSSVSDYQSKFENLLTKLLGYLHNFYSVALYPALNHTFEEKCRHYNLYL